MNPSPTRGAPPVTIAPIAERHDQRVGSASDGRSSRWQRPPSAATDDQQEDRCRTTSRACRSELDRAGSRPSRSRRRSRRRCRRRARRASGPARRCRAARRARASSRADVREVKPSMVAAPYGEEDDERDELNERVLAPAAAKDRERTGAARRASAELTLAPSSPSAGPSAAAPIDDDPDRASPP